MSRRKRRAEEIYNPQHYFNSFIALESKRDRARTNRYYEMFVSLEEIFQESDEGISSKVLMKFAVNTDGQDFDKALSELSEFAWIEQIENPVLYKAISSLSKQQKRLLTLRYVSCLTQKEAANIMGVSQQAVSCSEKRILQNIKKLLDVTCEDS